MATEQVPAARHWFYLLPQASANARLLYAARLAEKAWQQGDRVCLSCGDEAQLEALDLQLWDLGPDSFLPRRALQNSGDACPERLALLRGEPEPGHWDTVIVLAPDLPANADQFKRLALIASSDPAVLSQARAHFRQLRTLGIEAQVHDMRQR